MPTEGLAGTKVDRLRETSLARKGAPFHAQSLGFFPRGLVVVRQKIGCRHFSPFARGRDTGAVGGFLGTDERYIAVNTVDFEESYIGSDTKWHARMNATADQLKSAPVFKYSGRWNAGKS